jgi:hypothetical protein
MPNLKISELTTATAIDGNEYQEIIQGGVNKKLSKDLDNPNRGDYAGGTSFPSTGGRYTGGAPMRGDRWRLTGILTIGGTDIYAPGILIEAATNAPGQTTGNWIKIQTL